MSRESSAPTARVEHATVSDRLRALWASPGVAPALGVFLAARLGLGLYVLLVRVLLHPDPFVPDPVLRPYVGVDQVENVLLEPWQRWDTLYYQALAERGYGSFPGSEFAPPLFPWLMRWAGAALGGNTLLGGIVISNLAVLAALVYLFRLAESELGRASAGRTILYLASFPTAYFLLAAYSESLFVLAVVASLYHARRAEWRWSGLWAFVASLTRLQGAVLALVLAVEAWRQRREGKADAWALGAIALSAAGALVFPIYLWLGLHSSPWAIVTSQMGRYRGELSFPGAGLLVAARLLVTGQFLTADYFDFVLTLLFLGLLVWIFRHLPRVYGVYGLMMMVIALARVSGFEPLLSMSRYLLIVFPAFMALGRIGERPWLHRLILYPSWIGLLYLTGQFALWGWTG